MLNMSSLMNSDFTHTTNMMAPRSSLSRLAFTRPPILLAIGQFLESKELCNYSKLSKSVHSIWCYNHSPYSKFFITQSNNERKRNFSGTIKCSVTDNGLKFEWKCTKKEYENLLTKYTSDQFIECSAFEEPKTKTKWFIEIFPNGYHLSKQGYGALFLTMEWKPKNIKEVRARLLCNCPQVNLKFSDGVTYDWRKFSKGKHNAFKISDVMANDYITLSVELIVIDVTETETRVNTDIKDQIDGMHNKMLQLQSRMDEIDSVQHRLFNIEKMLSKFLVFQNQQQEKQEEFERMLEQELFSKKKKQQQQQQQQRNNHHHHNNNSRSCSCSPNLNSNNNDNDNDNDSNNNNKDILPPLSLTKYNSNSTNASSLSSNSYDYSINDKNRRGYDDDNKKQKNYDEKSTRKMEIHAYI